MEYLNTAYLTIHWNEKSEYVRMEWKKFVKGQSFRQGLNAGLDLIIEKGVSKWLADLRLLKVVDPEDQEWSNDNWFPRAIQGGIHSMAIVIPEDVFAKLSVNLIMEKAPKADLTVHYFENMEEAEHWLEIQE